MVTKWYSNALNNLGLAYQLQNNAPKAFDSYRKSLEVNPSFSLARENAMALLSALPDKAQAARYLEQLRRIPSK
jgi:tetratricopeptide (TPR) repeat protein